MKKTASLLKEPSNVLIFILVLYMFLRDCNFYYVHCIPTFDNVNLPSLVSIQRPPGLRIYWKLDNFGTSPKQCATCNVQIKLPTTCNLRVACSYRFLYSLGKLLVAQKISRKNHFPLRKSHWKTISHLEAP